jgi:hypothetical protein
MAERLGRDSLAARFDRLALGYRNVLDADGFARPRQNGAWLAPFEPREVNNHFTEANSWQYSFFVPHDLAGWMDLRGGPAAVERHLDTLFEAPEATTGRDQADITGLIGQYAHGNEPSHSFAYLYAATGAGWKTQRRVRQILDTLYRTTPAGLPGNEDCGQMSAWFVFSALGFYPVTPGTTTYALGTPLFSTARLRLPDGGTFTITGQPERGPYVHGAALNGRPHATLAIDHADLRAGGTLAFTNGAEASDWGAPMPLTRTADAGFVPAPVLQATRSFRDRQTVAVAALGAGTDLLVRRDDGPVRRYAGPFEIGATTTLAAWAVDAQGNRSAPTTGHLIARPNTWTVDLGYTYAPQYAAGGADALIDGIRGDAAWRKGDWQGTYDQDLVATVDFGAERDVRGVYASFLQDMRPWILFPPEVTFEVSRDGRAFEPVRRDQAPLPPDHAEAVTGVYGGAVPAVRARYLRVRAATFGPLPDWHLGAGYPAWLFADEIWVD